MKSIVDGVLFGGQMQSIYLHNDMQIGLFIRCSLVLPRCPCPGKNAICIQMTPTRWRNSNNCRRGKCSRWQFAGFLLETMIQKALLIAHFLNKSNANNFQQMVKFPVLVCIFVFFEIIVSNEFGLIVWILSSGQRDPYKKWVYKFQDIVVYPYML